MSHVTLSRHFFSIPCEKSLQDINIQCSTDPSILSFNWCQIRLSVSNNQSINQSNIV
jgi:hypothetical protein